VRAFITFLSQEGYDRCSKYISKSKTVPFMELYGEKVHFRAAPEPSNIIWENLEITGPTMKKREAIAGFWIIIFIVICFLAITALKAYSG
jgi:hypothetical protein